MALRYLEISRRNPVSRILVGSGSQCFSPRGVFCGDLCLEIRRAGTKDCSRDHDPCACHDTNDCCKGKCYDPCQQVAEVCALEIDDEGYAVFEWPEELYHFEEGWYEAHLMSDCSECGVIPLRIGPRCNVLVVEHVITGPDSACAVGCPSDCEDEICPPRSSVTDKSVYVPSYTIYTKEEPDGS